MVVMLCFSVTSIHSDLWLPINRPLVPGGIRALPEKPLAMASLPNVALVREASCAMHSAADRAPQGMERSQVGPQESGWGGPLATQATPVMGSAPSSSNTAQ